MEKKPSRQTRERILATALRLFNTLGEPAVTPAAIAVEMEISPGNLYYHFHSKTDIVNALFARYEEDIGRLLLAVDDHAQEPEDIWLFLHLLFETICQYRFFYHDINNLLLSNRLVETHFTRILRRKEEAAATLCHNLARAGVLQAGDGEIQALAVNMALVCTFWISYEHARSPRTEPDIGRGAYQVMQLAAPYLQGEARTLLERISHHYLARQ
ncbi:TetR/AcrR family transcriptional regulator [Craterilacuibacter sp. RT1T]|uniref:TetR/AcrR family transcriptional regulator n=1 Tax=Craterilacuibacter sp. RT1T TaxID=2942211 RepID=UPI0020BF8B45|nr:TetR/AcrR family transcriptional regulator [Craterilacuibacter sp. RT1T]MCL6262428.1 TetR/AcrR family transcriptional regulator [Craterilacuibacter sp. RT1T]